MGTVRIVNFVSLDGVIQSPLAADEDRDGGFDRGGWVPPSSDDTVADYMREATTSAAGMLLGRRSYEILAAAWSSADPSEPAVAAMNRMPKYVASRRALGADDLAWENSERLGDDLPADVRALTERVEGELVVFGSGVLVASLAAHDLVDEYRLLLFPVVVGTGKRMFGDDGAFTRFRLAGSTTSPSGVVMLTYVRP